MQKNIFKFADMAEIKQANSDAIGAVKLRSGIPPCTRPSKFLQNIKLLVLSRIGELGALIILV
jgi:hypothetical protein